MAERPQLTKVEENTLVDGHRLRVMQVLPALGDGGVERSTLEMAGYLSRQNAEHWVVSGGGRLVPDVVAAGAQAVVLPVGEKSPLAIIANARALGRLIDAHKIDVVHARSRAPAWAAWLACRWFSHHPTRYLTTFHGVYSHGSALKRAYNRVMLKGRVVIANSRFIKNHIVSVYGYPDNQIIVAPRGIEPALFEPALYSCEFRQRIRAEFQLHEAEPMLIIVGRLTGWKGHSVLVEALERLKDLPWKLVVAGGGDADFVQNLKRQITVAGLSDRIILTGSRKDVPALLAVADLAYSTSTRPEAFGRASIEAQAMETPIIATDHGGSRETVIPGVTGWLVAPSDSLALSAVTREALSDPARLKRMGLEGRANVLAHFTTERMLEAEFSAYRRLLAKPVSS